MVRPQVYAGFIFQVRKQIAVTTRYCLQVYVIFHILVKKTGIYNLLGLKYMLGFIFWVEKQVSTTVSSGFSCKYMFYFISQM